MPLGVPSFPARAPRLGARARLRRAGRGPLPGVLDVVWSLRHLKDLDEVDWSVAARDPTLIAVLDRAFAGLYEHYFRVETRGLDALPTAPALLVGNHSGFGVAELLMLLVSWHRRFGPERPVHALAHRWLYETPFLRVAVPKIGGVPATWDDARAVLASGRDLAVFPGGEQESTRPLSERYRIALHGHRGFVRLALANDVPIVPFVTIGSHATMILPPGMHALATVTGARRFLGLEAVPLPLQVLAWLAGGIALEWSVLSPAAYLLLLLATPPLYPSKIVTHFGRAIRPDELRAAAAPGEDPVDAGYRHVESTMQRMMDALAAERRSLFS